MKASLLIKSHNPDICKHFFRTGLFSACTMLFYTQPIDHTSKHACIYCRIFKIPPLVKKNPRLNPSINESYREILEVEARDSDALATLLRVHVPTSAAGIGAARRRRKKRARLSPGCRREGQHLHRASFVHEHERNRISPPPPSFLHAHTRARAHTNTLYIALVTLCLRRRSNLENKITTDCPKVAESRRSE